MREFRNKMDLYMDKISEGLNKLTFFRKYVMLIYTVFFKHGIAVLVFTFLTVGCIEFNNYLTTDKEVIAKSAIPTTLNAIVTTDLEKPTGNLVLKEINDNVPKITKVSTAKKTLSKDKVADKTYNSVRTENETKIVSNNNPVNQLQSSEKETRYSQKKVVLGKSVAVAKRRIRKVVVSTTYEEKETTSFVDNESVEKEEDEEESTADSEVSFTN